MGLADESALVRLITRRLHPAAMHTLSKDAHAAATDAARGWHAASAPTASALAGGCASAVEPPTDQSALLDADVSLD